MYTVQSPDPYKPMGNTSKRVSTYVEYSAEAPIVGKITTGAMDSGRCRIEVW